jgi:hypothetical protein
MKKTAKLRLSRQTIRQLTDAGLSGVRGGQAEADAPDYPRPISVPCTLGPSWPCSAYTCPTLITCPK